MTAPTGQWLDAGVEAASERFMMAASRLGTLWKLGADWDQLLLKAEDPECDPAEVEAELDQLAGDIMAKAYGVAVTIQKIEKMAEWEKAESRRLAEKSKADEAMATRLREYTLRCMNNLGTKRIETGTFTLSIRANPPHVDILNEPVLARVEAYETMPDIPPEFVRLITLYKVDKRAIAAQVKDTGVSPPGTDVTRGERLELR